MRENLKASIVEYNNKSRSGTYIKIYEKGQRPRLFKYDNKVHLDHYVQAYESGAKGKQLKELENEWITGKGRVEQYITELREQRRISNALQRGSTVRKNNLASLANPAKRDYEHRKLLEPLVLDKRLIDLLLQNKSKLKKRFGHGITIWGRPTGQQHETILAHITDIGNRTLDEVYKDYFQNQEMKQGSKTEYE